MEACPAGPPTIHPPPARVPPHGQEVQALDNCKHCKPLYEPCLPKVELHPAIWVMSGVAISQLSLRALGMAALAWTRETSVHSRIVVVDLQLHWYAAILY